MGDIYFYMIIALAVLAVADLVVGVSNDAVNFLNSAIGSKAISFKTIMIVASLGIAAGAIFSSGLMEVARKGIFVPSEFFFDEIMVIFMAVMITDILLLDFFNTLGMPTSTTVSIVFELLGAAVCVALIKIYSDPENAKDLAAYINTTKAVQIISGILLSVVVAFSVGALVQWITRLLLSFEFRKKANWVGALFGGVALTAILYFIFIKGIKGTNYAKSVVAILYDDGVDGALQWVNSYFDASYETLAEFAKKKKDLYKIEPTSGKIALTLRGFLETNVLSIVSVGFLIWSLLSYLIITVFKIDIYKVIIIVGTFALALAFAGNDLVNFIGVPVAAWASYQKWVASGVDPHEFSMAFLGDKANTPTTILLVAGFIMVLTLWLSSKAKEVVKTELNLSRQGEGKERFKANLASRVIVRSLTALGGSVEKILPESFKKYSAKQYDQTVINSIEYVDPDDRPAFDLVRASVNLTMAGILISLATSLKLPLSTTYVTFMVAMGTSLADKAWGKDSAVYRVAGVLNVIGGWFLTAFAAFTAAALLALLIHFGGPIMIAVLLVLALFIIYKNYQSFKKKEKF